MLCIARDLGDNGCWANNGATLSFRGMNAMTAHKCNSLVQAMIEGTYSESPPPAVRLISEMIYQWWHLRSHYVTQCTVRVWVCACVCVWGEGREREDHVTRDTENAMISHSRYGNWRGADSPAHRHGKVENGEHSQPLLSREQVGNHCWGNGGIASLTDSN